MSNAGLLRFGNRLGQVWPDKKVSSTIREPEKEIPAVILIKKSVERIVPCLAHGVEQDGIVLLNAEQGGAQPPVQCGRNASFRLLHDLACDVKCVQQVTHERKLYPIVHLSAAFLFLFFQ